MISGFDCLHLKVDIESIKQNKNKKVDIAEVVKLLQDMDVDPKGKELLARLVAVIQAELRELVCSMSEEKAISILNTIEKAIFTDSRLVLAFSQIIQEAYIKAVLEPELDLETLKKEVELNREFLKGAKEHTYEAFILGSTPADKERANKLVKIVKDPKFDPIKSSVVLDGYNDCRRLNKITSFAMQPQSDPIDKKIYEQISLLKIGEYSSLFELFNSSGEKIYVVLRLLSTSDIQISSQSGVELSLRSALDKKANEKAAQLLEHFIIDSRNQDSSSMGDKKSPKPAIKSKL